MAKNRKKINIISNYTTYNQCFSLLHQFIIQSSGYQSISNFQPPKLSLQRQEALLDHNFSLNPWGHITQRWNITSYPLSHLEPLTLVVNLLHDMSITCEPQYVVSLSSRCRSNVLWAEDNSVNSLCRYVNSNQCVLKVWMPRKCYQVWMMAHRKDYGGSIECIKFPYHSQAIRIERPSYPL